MDLHEPDHRSIEITEPRQVKRLTRRSKMAILLLIVGCAVAVFIAGSVVVRRFTASAPAQQVTESTPGGDTNAFTLTQKQWTALKIQPVKMAVFQDASETDGKIAIDDDLVTPVFSPYSGRVTRLVARAGDIVRTGDPLFGIQATELAQAQNDLITAMAGLRTAKAQLNLEMTNEKRQHDLYVAQGAALKDWQQAQVDLATAQGGMNSASIAVAAVRNRLRAFGKSDPDIEQLAATSDILRVDADTVITAPITGTVVQRQIGLGQNIVSASSGASNPVFMIGDLSKVWLIGNVREDDATFIHSGDVVEVKVRAVPNKVFKARVTYVAASIDANTHRLAVRAEVDNPIGELKPEMFASFRIITGTGEPAPAIPDSAIVYEGEDAHVWLAEEKSRSVKIQRIKVGHNRDSLVEALDGLKPGDMIVTSGAVFIDRAVTGN